MDMRKHNTSSDGVQCLPAPSKKCGVNEKWGDSKLIFRPTVQQSFDCLTVEKIGKHSVLCQY